MILEMIGFEAVPLSFLLILISRAIIKINRQQLRFQFFISDIWAVTICMLPSIWCISNAIHHPDETSTFFACLITPCQLLGIVLFRLRHTISQRAHKSWLAIASGSAVGILFAGATCIGAGMYYALFHGYC